MRFLPDRVLIPIKMSDRVRNRAYVHIDTRLGLVDVVRGWPVPSTSAEQIEATTLLYAGTVGLFRTLLELFPEQRTAISEYLKDVAEAIADGTW